MNPERVLILGAGASRASRFELPTMQGFFVGALEGNPELEQFLAWFYPDLDPSKYNLEEVLTFLSLAKARIKKWGLAGLLPSSFEAERLYDAAIAVVRAKLAIQLGQPCEMHAGLVRSLARRDTIISLNYDLVADQALDAVEPVSYADAATEHRLGKLRQMLSAPSYVGQAPVSVANLNSLCGYYLKLHGSLNWVSCLNGDCANSRRFHISDVRTEVQNPFDGTPCISCGYVLRTAIIPPVATKRIEDSGLVAVIWNIALRELSTAEKITIVGLSVAPSDFEIQWLLRQAVQLRGGRSLEVAVVNPDPEHRARTTHALAGPGSRFLEYRDLGEYLDQTGA